MNKTTRYREALTTNQIVPVAPALAIPPWGRLLALVAPFVTDPLPHPFRQNIGLKIFIHILLGFMTFRILLIFIVSLLVNNQQFCMSDIGLTKAVVFKVAFSLIYTNLIHSSLILVLIQNFY